MKSLVKWSIKKKKRGGAKYFLEWPKTDNIQFGLPRAGIEKRHHAPKTGIIFSQNTDNRQKYSEKANQFAAVTFLTIHFLFVLFATVAFLCNETRERRSPIQAKKRH